MNKEQVREYAYLIVNKSIKITPYGNGNNIDFKYEHNKTIQSVIHNNKYRFKHEIDDSTILRDEVYATYYESLLKLIEKEDYTQDDMELIVSDINKVEHDVTKQFAGLLKGYMNNNLKAHLIDPSRRDR